MLKVAVVIFVIMLAYSGILSLMDIIVPKVAMGSIFKAVTGEALDSVQNAGYLKALKIGVISSGLYALSATIVGFFVLFAGFRKAQRWAWWSFLIGGGIGWLGGLILPIAIGDKKYIPILAIGMVIFLVGLLLPVKSFFTKVTEKA